MKQEQARKPSEPTLAHNAARSRYELSMDGDVVGIAEYRQEGDTVRFTHTQVEPQFKGQGLGARLAAHALDDVRRQGLKALPQCSFIAAFIKRHPEDYAALVAG